MIIAKNISKTYRNRFNTVLALDRVSLEINRGELFCLTGHDGAGKTTLFRILSTLVEQDSGEATVDGLDVSGSFEEIRKHVGYMPSCFSLYKDLSVEENLKFFASMFDTSLESGYDIIRDIYVQIEPFKTRLAGMLSGGMKQKLALCCALIHKPHVLFLDEPTTGVDPVSRIEFWQILKRLNAEGITIMVSTPYMDEVMLCDRIAFIHSGKILSVDTPHNFIDRNTDVIFEIHSANNFALLKNLRQRHDVNSCYMFGDVLHTVFKNNILPTDLPQDIIDIKKNTPVIEDCFIKLMKD